MIQDGTQDGSCDCGGIRQTPDTTGQTGQTGNRPGLSAIAYRLGTHASFLQAMKNRLTAYYAQLAQMPDATVGASAPSQPPATRDSTDPAIAWLDAWALVGDVLTFYQERIANEGYLRTATERRSVLELTSLIGYVSRPGVSASAHLAYGLQDLASDADVTIPAGSKVQSMSPTGGAPQTFETSSDLTARASWSQLAPRLTAIQQLTPDMSVVYAQGTSTSIKPNDPVLIVTSGGAVQTLRKVASVDSDLVNKRITLTMQDLHGPSDAAGAANAPASGTAPSSSPSPAAAGAVADASRRSSTGSLIRQPKLVLKKTARPGPLSPLENTSLMEQLQAPRAQAPPDATQLPQTLDKTLLPTTDVAPQLLAAFHPTLRAELYDTLRGVVIPADVSDGVHMFHVSAKPFGANAPMQAVISCVKTISRERTSETDTTSISYQDWSFTKPAAPASNQSVTTDPSMTAPDATAQPTQYTEQAGVIDLDNGYSGIAPGGWVVIERNSTGSSAAPVISQATDVRQLARADYGVSGNTTRITLAAGKSWIDPTKDLFPDAVRGSIVYAQSEQLTLAETPVTTPISGNQIELADVYDGLKPGRWLIVSGERVDLPGTSGVQGTELMMLQSAEHGVSNVTTSGDAAPTATSGSTAPSGDGTAASTPAPGDRIRTTLNLALNGLTSSYKRDTVTVYGNVVPATHGETHAEILGSGDGRAALRTFTLAQSPLTFVSAATPTGVASTLQVSVNGVIWREVDSFDGASPTDRVYVTRETEDAKTRVTFGDGVHGAALPPGVENVTASYRSGIGTAGNAPDGQVSLLMSRPLGVKNVTNPIAASGGADPESAGEIRRHAGRGLASLDRLVSVSDYEDFTRHFAGVGKASTTQLSAGSTRVVHITVAASGHAAMDDSAPLIGNLRAALYQYGDPHVPLMIQACRMMLLVISANVRVSDDSLWETVSPAVRSALADAFSFGRRELGQSVMLSEVIATIQNVSGVQYVDVDVLDRVDEATLFDDLRRICASTATRPKQMVRALPARPGRLPDGTRGVLPAEIAFIDPNVPETLTLTEIIS